MNTFWTDAAPMAQSVTLIVDSHMSQVIDKDQVPGDLETHGWFRCRPSI
jgi:hypothetical protein